MNNRPILFFDSGIGGLPYLTHLKNRLPNENFIYVADSKNFPYGDKKEEDLLNIITNTVNKIVDKFDPKVVVIACNTASVTALSELRSNRSIPIVGVVPAIKTASNLTQNNKIGIMATNRTVEGEYLKRLIEEFSPDCEVVKVGASKIVTFVERDYHNSENNSILPIINDAVKEFSKMGVDSVVLGCTHFIHVADEIKVALGKEVKVIDSREGVSNQVMRVISVRDNKKTAQDSFYLTKDLKDCRNYRFLCNRADLKFKGEIKFG